MGIQWRTDPESYLHYLHVGYACTQLKGVTAVRDSHANVFFDKKKFFIGSKNRILGPCSASPFFCEKSEAHALMIELTLFRLFACLFLFLAFVY